MGQGEVTLYRNEAKILVRRQRRTLQALYASAQGSVARVRIVCPDLVEHRRAIVSRRHGTARLVHQTPADACRTGSEQVAKHTEARRLRREETFRSIQVANQAAPLGCHVQHQLQALPRQPGQFGITAYQAQVPSTAQAVAQSYAIGSRQVERSLVRRLRLLFAGQMTMCVVSHRQRRRPGKGQARHESASRNRHRPTCINREARFIQLERSFRRQIYRPHAVPQATRQSLPRR